MIENDSLNYRINLNNALIPLGLYGELIKGKQTALLLYTAVFAYLITGYPNKYDFVSFILLIVALFLTVAGSTLLNMYIDRDIDAVMERTSQRALPAMKIPPISVLWHGLVFSTMGLLIALLVNWLTAIVIFTGLFFDAVIYSVLLKRKTKWSIIFGGISGGMPALAGRTAIINQIDIVGLLFVALILIWIPLHILSLATLPKALIGYEDAGVPMWPVESGVEETRKVITLSSFIDGVVIIATGYYVNINILAQIPLIIMAFVMIFLAIRNFKNPTHKGTFVLFKFASMFLMIVFLWLYVSVVISPRLDLVFAL